MTSRERREGQDEGRNGQSSIRHPFCQRASMQPAAPNEPKFTAVPAHRGGVWALTGLGDLAATSFRLGSSVHAVAGERHPSRN